MLATEHWSVLATRSTTQAELLSRITIYLTLVSAGLLTLGLLGNATRFAGGFAWAAIGVLFFLSAVGFLTLVRVANGSTEDLAHVIAMNQLRGAYVDLDPGLEQYLLASPYDDEIGWGRTYFPFADRSGSQVMGSAGFLIMVVEAALLATLAGALIATITDSIAAAVATGLVVLALAIVGFAAYAYRTYRSVLSHHVPLKVTPPPQG